MSDKITAADIKSGSITTTKASKAGEIVGWTIVALIAIAIGAGGMLIGKIVFSTHTIETVEVVTSVPKVCERALTHAERSHHNDWASEQYQKAAQLATNDYQDAWAKGDTELMAKLLEEGNNSGLERDISELKSIGHWNKFQEDAQACRQQADKAPAREASLTSRD